MASSNQGNNRDHGPPPRSTGRTFASIDPERVREVVPGAQADEQPPASQAGRVPSASERRQQQASNPAGGEGGSGRR